MVTRPSQYGNSLCSAGLSVAPSGSGERSRFGALGMATSSAEPEDAAAGVAIDAWPAEEVPRKNPLLFPLTIIIITIIIIVTIITIVASRGSAS